VIGNEVTRDRTWQGDIYGITFFNRALSAEEIEKRAAPDVKPADPGPPVAPPVPVPLPPGPVPDRG
jgi:hypothetical protein